MKKAFLCLFVLIIIVPGLLYAQQQQTVYRVRCGDGFITKPAEQCDPNAELRKNNGCPPHHVCVECQCVKEGEEQRPGR